MLATMPAILCMRRCSPRIATILRLLIQLCRQVLMRGAASCVPCWDEAAACEAVGGPRAEVDVHPTLGGSLGPEDAGLESGRPTFVLAHRIRGCHSSGQPASSAEHS